MLTIKSVLFTSKVHRVLAVLLFEALREVAWCAKSNLVGNLLNGLGGVAKQDVTFLQTHASEQLDRCQSCDGLDTTVKLYATQPHSLSQVIHLQVGVRHLLAYCLVKLFGKEHILRLGLG